MQFERPDSSKGALYYDYSSNGSYDSQVTEDAATTVPPPLSPASYICSGKDYSGTVHIPFTGWDTKGNRFSGTVAVEWGARVTAMCATPPTGTDGSPLMTAISIPCAGS